MIWWFAGWQLSVGFINDLSTRDQPISRDSRPGYSTRVCEDEFENDCIPTGPVQARSIILECISTLATRN